MALQNGMVYLIPGTEYTAKLVSREGEKEKIFYYNPVLRDFIMVKAQNALLLHEQGDVCTT